MAKHSDPDQRRTEGLSPSQFSFSGNACCEVSEQMAVESGA
jgi:hypothetical protein